MNAEEFVREATRTALRIRRLQTRLKATTARLEGVILDELGRQAETALGELEVEAKRALEELARRRR